MTNVVDPPACGVNANVRTPLKRGANPPVHVMRASGTTSEIVGVNVRSVPGTWTRMRWPSRISPSIAVTVEFQRGKALASVNSAQILAGGDWMLISTRHSKENMPRVFVMRGRLGVSDTAASSLQGS